MTVRLSLQEQFPTDNFDPKQPHVELADSVEPSEIVLSGNSSSAVFVNMKISHYVPRHHRSKVTLLATALQSNSLQPIKEEVSFYFLVLDSGTSITHIDQSPP